MIYFTSDLHIGHDKDFIWKDRGFSSIEEHDSAILERWNNTITRGDTVYILGDLCLGQNEKEWDRFYNHLNGTKNFLRGNHDTDNKIIRYILNYTMEYLGYATVLKYNKNWTFYLCHYPTYVENPYESYKKKHIINLFGHTHQHDIFFKDNPCMYHVGVDSHNLTPVSIEQIIKDVTNKLNEVKK